MFAALLNVLAELTVIFIAMTSAKKFHRKALSGVMRSPHSFFEHTPIGRIVNRFSKDMDHLEHSLPWVTKSFMHTAPKIVVTVVVVMMGTPKIMFFLVPLFMVYFVIQVSRTLCLVLYNQSSIFFCNYKYVAHSYSNKVLKQQKFEMHIFCQPVHTFGSIL